ncbi:hypothetical protein [Variovorax saccharolyticus]|uniref:hypothetical protein n=1 Tax=Variovorax saccharolyticus TaxID=3053516 RepID=UPI002576FC0C|nr:hypothetical protein [Variovorax sp. J22R187]MDM0019612.1 hypothetical protein [Variovorax sp. J22R187]
MQVAADARQGGVFRADLTLGLEQVLDVRQGLDLERRRAVQGDRIARLLTALVDDDCRLFCSH